MISIITLFFVKVPHVAVVGLVIRDLLVCLIVLPAALGKRSCGHVFLG
jgi:hypothetical protein